MKHNTKTLLAAAFHLLSWFAFAGYSFAQTPTPTPAASPTPNPNAGTYMDGKLSVPQRLQLANAVLSSGTDAASIGKAASWMLSARPVVHLVTLYPAFADSVIADPTLGATVEGTGLLASAVVWKVDATAALDDKIAFLADKLQLAGYSDTQTLSVKGKYAGLVTQKAQLQYSASNYNGAIAIAMPVVGWGCQQTIPLVFNSKLALRSPDLLQWALLIYTMTDYGHGQDGINAIGSAFRALDGNLVRQNQFNSYTTSGTGTNPMAGVTLPQVTFLGTSPQVEALNYAVKGDYLNAFLTVNNKVFAKAAQGPSLNAALSLNAQWIRNKDGNVSRANPYVSAITSGQAYPLAELSGTATGN